MTVAELITELQKLPQDAKVLAYEDAEIDWVEIVAANLISPLVVHLETAYDEF